MTKVFCLYRVSTKSQVNYVDTEETIKEDIPVQRIACHQYCDERGWKIAREFQETAVSAYFTPTFGRDAIQQILASAQNHEFDILLVFTLDRLSRRDYEFPMLIEQITENGISVWSVKDGECSYRTPTDRLLVYLAGWRASCESERLGERIKTAQAQMVTRGEYRGGPVPYGYKLAETGQLNRAGKPKKEILIHSEEAEVVRMIFRKLADGEFTLYELARYLQSYSFPVGVRNQKWHRSTLQSMLRNPIYIGCMQYGDVTSPPFEKLQIIDPDLFQTAQAVVHKRASRQKQNRTYQPVTRNTPAYHDILFCGHCGAPLVFTHAFQWNKSGECTIRYYYRCYGKERFADTCDGACSYSATIMDTKIRAYVDLIARTLLYGDMAALVANAIENERARHIVSLTEIRSQQEKLQTDIETVQGKIADSLRQYGIAATTPLELFYQDLCAKQSILNAESEDLLKQQRRSPEKMMKNKTIELNKLKALCAKYLAASVSDAESLITQLICKIRIGRNYHLQFEPIPEIREFVCFADEIAQSLLDNCSAKLPPALPEI